MSTLKVASLWIVGIIFYLSVMGFAMGRWNHTHSEVSCSEFVWPDRKEITFDEARSLIDKYDACTYKNNVRGENRFFSSLVWPIYLPVSYGIEAFDAQE